jgi:hypothetical protein
MTPYEVDKLDRMFQEKVVGSCGKCAISGSPAELAHHFILRRNKATRWYLPNGVPLTSAKHTGDTLSAHKNPTWFKEQMILIRGQEWYEDLRNQSNKIFKGTYKQVLDYLEGRSNNYC